MPISSDTSPCSRFPVLNATLLHDMMDIAKIYPLMQKQEMQRNGVEFKKKKYSPKQVAGSCDSRNFFLAHDIAKHNKPFS